MESAGEYLSALKWPALTGLYGFICSISRLGAGFKSEILEAVRLRGDEHVADIGCGTGTLLRILTHRYPHMRAYGIDPDPSLLASARRSLGVAKERLELQQGVAQAIPKPDGTFDAVFCTLTLHHMPDSQKERALAEMFRILKPGGRVVVADFYRKHAWWPGIFPFENRSYIKSCLEGRMPLLLEEAGFSRVVFIPLDRPSLAISIGCKPRQQKRE